MVCQAREIFREAPSLVDVSIAQDAHITTCGDVHGQFYDLLNIFELNGLPSEDNPYLFNGACFCSLLDTLLFSHCLQEFEALWGLSVCRLGHVLGEL